MELKFKVEIEGEWHVMTFDELHDAITFGNDLKSNRRVIWTGLPDKHGKEIYEGDVVKDPYGQLGVVTMLNGSYKLVGNGKKLGFGSYAKQCEIIGNIHQNPELIS